MSKVVPGRRSRGERAHQPLADPNNYAALMYLVWIPLAHQYVAQGWRGARTASVRHALVLASSFMLVLAIIATLAATLFYLAGLMSPELALLIGR